MTRGPLVLAGPAIASSIPLPALRPAMTSFEFCKIPEAKPREQMMVTAKRYAGRAAIIVAGALGALALIAALMESYRLSRRTKTGSAVRIMRTIAPAAPVRTGVTVSLRSYTGPDRRVCQMIDQRAGELRRTTDIPLSGHKRNPPPFSALFRFPVAIEKLEA
ncbi:hypothetical protein [Polymorphobacter megasporae]|uniref:hypothetical protein n=1 Tax=Glacieibacterium megasporae TaxID=2835787 RepID=UPI001C1E7D9A|nr:hypothetical protein [Polymorphobacter megasporae]UAJ09479.1 hypothetical protein KTC28_14335 [Polymorphobacter megasporae]